MLNRAMIMLTRNLPRYLKSKGASWWTRVKDNPIEGAMEIGAATGATIGSTIGAICEASEAMKYSDSSTTMIIKAGLKGGAMGGAIGGVTGYLAPLGLGLSTYAVISMVESQPLAVAGVVTGTVAGVGAAAIFKKSKKKDEDVRVTRHTTAPRW